MDATRGTPRQLAAGKDDDSNGDSQGWTKEGADVRSSSSIGSGAVAMAEAALAGAGAEGGKCVMCALIKKDA
jgi:hypothetical protein